MNKLFFKIMIIFTLVIGSFVCALDFESQLDPRVFAGALRRVTFEPPLTVAPKDVMFQKLTSDSNDVVVSGKRKRKTPTRYDLVYHHNHRVLREGSQLTRRTINQIAQKLEVELEALKIYYRHLLDCGKRLPAQFKLTAEHVNQFTLSLLHYMDA